MDYAGGSHPPSEVPRGQHRPDWAVLWIPWSKACGLGSVEAVELRCSEIGILDTRAAVGTAEFGNVPPHGAAHYGLVIEWVDHVGGRATCHQIDFVGD